MSEEDRSTDILAALERGEINADEAIRQLEGDDGPPATTAADPLDMPRHWPYFWTIPVTVGALGLFGGYGLATVGGWWWLAAGPLLALGGLLFIFGLASIESPWVHIRVQSDERGAVSEFGLSLPLPLKPAIWAIKRFGRYVPSLEKTSVDELLLAMEVANQSDGPIYVDVHEEDKGERVRVYLG